MVRCRPTNVFIYYSYTYIHIYIYIQNNNPFLSSKCSCRTRGGEACSLRPLLGVSLHFVEYRRTLLTSRLSLPYLATEQCRAEQYGTDQNVRDFHLDSSSEWTEAPTARVGAASVAISGAELCRRGHGDCSHVGEQEGACLWAVKAGQLPMLQYLRSMKPPCPLDSYGDLDMLQWLRSQANPCPWDEETCAQAAQNGHLEMLQWARSLPEPCPWDEKTCSMAAMMDHLHELHWARSQPEPCPWTDATAIRAAQALHI